MNLMPQISGADRNRIVRSLEDRNLSDKNNPMPNDRRNSRRFALSLSLEARGESPFNPQAVTGRSRNVSAKGIYFVCDKAYIPGQLLHIQMRLSGDMTDAVDNISLALRCRVQRVDKLNADGPGRFGVAVALDE